jgi:hypothetical protein
MPLPIFRTTGGEVLLPNADLVLVDRTDGGNLIINPPREVWERSELTPDELVQWSFLVAAAGRAMIDALPQLENGCVNYWEAGNWALNPAAEPRGLKTGPQHRRVHMHLLGRSRRAASLSWRWGEAPMFPAFHDRFSWAKPHRRLEPQECRSIVTRLREILVKRYSVPIDSLAEAQNCAECNYPAIFLDNDCSGSNATLCPECRRSS